MLRFGDNVTVINNVSKYPGIRGCFGVITYPVRSNEVGYDNYSYGITIPGKHNKSSKEGRYWIQESDLEVTGHYNADEMKKFTDSYEKNNRKNEDNTMAFGCNDGRERVEVVRRECVAVRNTGVVNIYFDNKQNEIRTKFDGIIETLINTDANVIEIKKSINAAIEAGVKDKDIAKCILTQSYWGSLTTLATQEAMDDADDQKDKTLLELMTKKREVNALLGACSTYEEELNILKGYGIVEIRDGGVTMK